MCGCSWKTEVLGSSDTGVMSSCELPDIGAGNQTQVPAKAVCSFSHQVVSPRLGKDSSVDSA